MLAQSLRCSDYRVITRSLGYDGRRSGALIGLSGRYSPSSFRSLAIRTGQSDRTLRVHQLSHTMAKRKISALSSSGPLTESMLPLEMPPAKVPRRASARAASAKISDLQRSVDEIDEASEQLNRATAMIKKEDAHQTNGVVKKTNVDAQSTVIEGEDFGVDNGESSLSELSEPEPERLEKTPSKKPPSTPKSTKSPAKSKAVKTEDDAGAMGVRDPEADDEGAFDDNAEEVQKALRRPPAVNSPYLPLPWKGRLGYACLNTYLRYSVPPVFSSRTCRIASILEHRHPLRDPLQPEHATKNRPDKTKPADVARGQRYVEEIGLANARDIIKMLRWNDKYNIKFFRLSSEMFPFASHEEYGYRLAPFASEVLEEVGKVVAELGHRVSTHPGQFTQLGSPRASVVENAFRDLDFHTELFDLMKLPPQQDRDAVLIMHMGGIFGSKEETFERFRTNYAKLSDEAKRRVVLENCDMAYSVHDLLPICEDLNIPLCLDWHHHNIIRDSSLREGTLDILPLLPRIMATFTRKRITPKMHYSEQTAPAITPKQRRKHSNRVMTLPPCPDNIDLMIEAKDKEQAVFELMRTYRLPGFERINPIIPHVREDLNKPESKRAPPTPKKAAKLKTPSKKRAQSKSTDVEDLEDMEVKLEGAAEDFEDSEAKPVLVADEDIAMGGTENRVYWPPGMDDWLRPAKRILKPKAEKGPSAKALKAGAPDNATATATDFTDDTNANMKTPLKKARKAPEIKTETPDAKVKIEVKAISKRPPKSRIGDRARAAKRNHEEAIRLANETAAAAGDAALVGGVVVPKADPGTEVIDFAAEGVEGLGGRRRRGGGRRAIKAEGVDEDAEGEARVPAVAPAVAVVPVPVPAPAPVKRRAVSRPKKHV